MDSGLLAGNGLHHAHHGVGLHRLQVGRHLVADRGVHDAVLPDDTGQLPRVHAVQARHVLLFQIGVQIAVRPEIGRRVTVLPDHIALYAAISLEVLPDDAVVSDEGIGLHNDLSRIAGVRQGLDIPAHAGGEHQLANCVGVRAEPHALEYPAVLQHQIAFFHTSPPRLPAISRFYMLKHIMMVFAKTVNVSPLSGK